MIENFHFRHGWFFAVFFLCGALVLANVVHYVLFRVLRHKETKSEWTGWGLQRYLGAPARTIFFVGCLLAVLPVVPGISFRATQILRQSFVMALIVAMGWLVIGCVYVFEAVLLRKYDLEKDSNMQARRVHTQFQLFRRVLIGFVVVVDIGALLWSFNDPRIWNYGSGLLASAGVASLILATAAKSTAANFLAGLQIALTEPIRIDDVVVIQGEWGRIEEINSAYVVVRIWDLRRLIVPLTYFIENSFQNWTRQTSDILGTAFLYVDYSVPVEALRSQLVTLVQGSAMWDGAVCKLQVTNLTERSMELRCLMSSRNSSENFDLRCLVREGMMAWVREQYPAAFPTMRFAATGEVGTGGGGAPGVAEA